MRKGLTEYKLAIPILPSLCLRRIFLIYGLPIGDRMSRSGDDTDPVIEDEFSIDSGGRPDDIPFLKRVFKGWGEAF